MKNKELEKLTPREEDIFKLILKGLDNRQIATKLDIAYSTTKVLVHRVFTKLKVESKNQLIVRYLK